jgi:hypothetical protein
MSPLELDRIEFRPRERLTARDLTDADAREATMRGFHLRRVHGTWGVATGLRAWATAEGNMVRVTQGAAFDCHGRAILVPDPVELRIPVPPKGHDVSWFDLAVSYDDPAHFAWHVAGPVRIRRPQPPMAPNIRLGEEVPLARFTVSGNTIWNADHGMRRGVRGPTLRVRGARISMSKVGGMSVLTPLLWNLQVNTAAASFRRIPEYFGWLDLAPGIGDANAASLRGLAGPFVSIVAPSPTGFVLQVRFGAIGFLRPIVSNLFDVVWFGMERQGPCPMRIDPDEAPSLPGYPFEQESGGDAARA